MFYTGIALGAKVIAAFLAAIVVTSSALALSLNNNDACGVAGLILHPPHVSIKNFEPMTLEFDAHILAELDFECDDGDESDCRLCVRSTLDIWIQGILGWISIDGRSPVYTELKECGSLNSYDYETLYNNVSLGPHYRVTVYVGDDLGHHPCGDIFLSESKEFSYSSP